MEKNYYYLVDVSKYIDFADGEGYKVVSNYERQCETLEKARKVMDKEALHWYKNAIKPSIYSSTDDSITIHAGVKNDEKFMFTIVKMSFDYMTQEEEKSLEKDLEKWTKIRSQSVEVNTVQKMEDSHHTMAMYELPTLDDTTVYGFATVNHADTTETIERMLQTNLFYKNGVEDLLYLDESIPDLYQDHLRRLAITTKSAYKVDKGTYTPEQLEEIKSSVESLGLREDFLFEEEVSQMIEGVSCDFIIKKSALNRILFRF